MPVLTKINSNVIAEDAITGDKLGGSAYLANSTTQNITGTYSENRLYTSDAYTLSGNVTVNSYLTLSSVKPTADVVITAGGAYTITGTGVLEGGSLILPVKSVTGMTGELGSTVTGTLGSGFTISSGVTVPTDNYAKTYHTLLAHGYTNSSTVANYGSGQGLPGTTDGILVGTSPSIVLDGTQEVSCIINQQIGEWQQNGQTLMVCWGTKDGGSTYQFMGGNEAGSHSTLAVCSWKAGTGGRHGLLAAGTWVFTCRMGVGAAQTYGSWWGGSGVYGGDQWGHPGTIGGESSTAGNMIIQVGGST